VKHSNAECGTPETGETFQCGVRISEWLVDRGSRPRNTRTGTGVLDRIHRMHRIGEVLKRLKAEILKPEIGGRCGDANHANGSRILDRAFDD